MSLTVNQRPSANNGWSAGWNPIVYKMQRKDYNITAVANSGGALQITVNTNLTTLTTALGGPVIAGATMWVTTDNGVYNGLYTVVTVTNAASSVVTFSASTYISAATTGYINLTQRTGYYVNIDVYAGNGAPSTASLFTLRYTADKTGYIYIDVSVLNKFLLPESFNQLTRGNPTNNYKCVKNINTSYKFYIKYTEIWTNSAQSQVDDVANQYYIVHGARQVGELYGGYLKEYTDATGRLFINKFTRPRIWTGRKFSMSFIDPSPSGTTRTHIKKTRYNSDGSVWGATYDLNDYSGGTPNPTIFENIEDLTPTYNLLYDKQDTGSTAWTLVAVGTLPTVTLAASAFSNRLLSPLFLKVGQTYSISVAMINSNAPIGVTLEAVQLNGTVVATQTLTPGAGTPTALFSLTPAVNDAFYLRLRVQGNAAGGTYSLTSWSVVISIVNKVDYQIVTHTSPPFTITETVVSETKTCDVQPEPCDPTIHLIWKNFLGGDQSWCFDWNQKLTMRITKEKKLRQNLLFAGNITQNEVDVLSELITSGDEYETPILELTTSVRKIKGVNGQQVYIISTDGTRIGVIVAPDTLKTETQYISHNLDGFTIEYPETIHPR